jgi:thymidylate synthase
MADEGWELLGVAVGFPAAAEADAVLAALGNPEMIAEMKKVFFMEGPNSLGHSYLKLMRGPAGRNDLEDVISLLHTEPWTKRAAVTLCGPPNGKVPCINAVQFLVREGAVRTSYFARGQDAFQKFYADGLCLGMMAQKVARGLQLPAGKVSGFIASSHVYRRDLPAIQEMLARGQTRPRNEVPPG